jgi:hypothetical protein
LYPSWIMLTLARWFVLSGTQANTCQYAIYNKGNNCLMKVTSIVHNWQQSKNEPQPDDNVILITNKYQTPNRNRQTEENIIIRTMQGIAVWIMVLNTTFNNISAISLRPVLLMEETRVPWEYYRPVASQGQTLSHNVVSSTPRHEQDSNSQC